MSNPETRLVIRLPLELRQQLERAARANRRSVTKQLQVLIEQSVRVDATCAQREANDGSRGCC